MSRANPASTPKPSTAANTRTSIFSKPPAAASLSTITTTTAGSTFFSSTAGASKVSPPDRNHEPSLQKQSRRHFHGRHRQSRPAPFRMGASRVRGRLRQRRLRRSLRHLLRKKRSLPQQRQRHLHGRQRKIRRRRKRQALEHRLRFRGLRSRRPPRSFRRQLHRSRPEDRAGSRIRTLPLQRHHGRVRSAGTQRRQKYSLSQQRRRHLHGRERKIRHPQSQRHLRPRRAHRRSGQRRLAGHLRRQRFDGQRAVSKQKERNVYRRRP